MDLYYLFHWEKQNIELSHWVGHLKGAHFPQPLLNYFFSFLPSSLFLSSAALQVCPLKSTQKFSGAQCLGEALLANYPIGRIEGLQHLPDSLPQKILSREQRLQKQFQRTGPRTLSYRQILFVDDVVTTGGSLKAAREAFAEAEFFTGISLFYRPLAQEVH